MQKQTNRQVNYNWKLSDTFKVFHILFTAILFITNKTESFHMLLVGSTILALLATNKRSCALFTGNGSVDHLNTITKIVSLISTGMLALYYITTIA